MRSVEKCRKGKNNKKGDALSSVATHFVYSYKILKLYYIKKTTDTRAFEML